MSDLGDRVYQAAFVTDIYTIGYGGYRGLMAGLGMPVDVGSSDLEIVLAGLSGLTAAKWLSVLLSDGSEKRMSHNSEDEQFVAGAAFSVTICATELGVGYVLGYGVGKLIDLL
jgi:hypothetical protein